MLVLHTFLSRVDDTVPGGEQVGLSALVEARLRLAGGNHFTPLP